MPISAPLWRRASARAGEDVRILYGGSMKPDNAAAILQLAEVNGGLVGGASLKSADFLAIVRRRTPAAEGFRTAPASCRRRGVMERDL